jgi:hypothetical protein
VSEGTEVAKGLMGEDLVVPTREANEAAVESDKEGWADDTDSRILSEEEINPGSKLVEFDRDQVDRDDEEDDDDESGAPDRERKGHKDREVYEDQDAAERAAYARLKRIENLSKKNRSLNEKLERLEKVVEEVQSHLGPKQDPMEGIPDEYRDDPAVKALVEKIAAVKPAPDPKEEARRREQSEVVEYGASSAREFVQRNPNLPSAYQYLRGKIMQQNSLTPGNPEHEVQMAGFEYSWTKEKMDQGLDPASLIYDEAVAAGWSPNGAGPGANVEAEVEATPDPKAPRRQMVSSNRVRKMKAGADSTSMSDMHGSNDTRGGSISLAEFQRRYSDVERHAIFNDRVTGNEAFSELAQSGRISTRFLPR